MRTSLALAAALAFCAAIPPPAAAHCDGLDGPVVQAGRQALDRGDVRLALAWIQPAGEAEVREAFSRAIAVRKLGPEAKELADRYFFEALVRVHRAGEGEPYTGLKPAGRDLGPAIPAADRAIASGSAEPLLRLLRDDMQSGIQQRFQHVLRARKFDGTDVDAGRAYVKAYVQFIHYVEGIHQAAAGSEAHSEER